jgi:hypothetical protein
VSRRSRSGRSVQRDRGVEPPCLHAEAGRAILERSWVSTGS